jgi:hypothetical protein
MTWKVETFFLVGLVIMHKSSLCTMHKLLSAPPQITRAPPKLLVHPPNFSRTPKISHAPPKFLAHPHMTFAPQFFVSPLHISILNHFAVGMVLEICTQKPLSA